MLFYLGEILLLGQGMLFKYVRYITASFDHQYVNNSHIIPSQVISGIFDWNKKDKLFIFKDFNQKGMINITLGKFAFCSQSEPNRSWHIKTH